MVSLQLNFTFAAAATTRRKLFPQQQLSIVSRGTCQCSSIALSLHESKEYAYELEEARLVLDNFLKQRGLVLNISQRKSKHSLAALVVNHVHCRYKDHYSTGKELTTLEIREAMLSYLQDLEKQEGDNMFQMNTLAPQLHQHIPSDRQHISSSDALSFCIDVLGLDEDDLPRIIRKRPQLLHSSVDNVLDPNRAYLESLGIQKESWRKIMLVFPHILAYSSSKVSTLADFLVEEVGISRDLLGKILTRFPHLVGYSVENNLRPSLRFFQDFGVENVAVMFIRCPQAFGLSLEHNIKPTLGFFQEKGFSQAQVSVMLSKFPQVLSFSSCNNLSPKWDFFVTTQRSMEELVDFPQYFSYKLEARIKSRHHRAERRISLNRMLTCSDEDFDKLVQKQLQTSSSPRL